MLRREAGAQGGSVLRQPLSLTSTLPPGDVCAARPGGLCGLPTGGAALRHPVSWRDPAPCQLGTRVWARVSPRPPSSRGRRRAPSGPPGGGVPVRGRWADVPSLGLCDVTGARALAPCRCPGPCAPLTGGSRCHRWSQAEAVVTPGLLVVQVRAFPGVRVLQRLTAWAVLQAPGVQSPASGARAGRFRGASPLPAALSRGEF